MASQARTTTGHRYLDPRDRRIPETKMACGHTTREPDIFGRPVCITCVALKPDLARTQATWVIAVDAVQAGDEVRVLHPDGRQSDWREVRQVIGDVIFYTAGGSLNLGRLVDTQYRVKVRPAVREIDLDEIRPAATRTVAEAIEADHHLTERTA